MVTRERLFALFAAKKGFRAFEFFKGFADLALRLRSATPREKSVVHVGQRIHVEAERLVAMTTDCEDAIFFFRCETIVESWIEIGDFLHAFAFILAEVDDH